MNKNRKIKNIALTYYNNGGKKWEEDLPRKQK